LLFVLVSLVSGSGAQPLHTISSHSTRRELIFGNLRDLIFNTLRHLSCRLPIDSDDFVTSPPIRDIFVKGRRIPLPGMHLDAALNSGCQQPGTML
jgi:hypothetical protein